MNVFRCAAIAAAISLVSANAFANKVTRLNVSAKNQPTVVVFSNNGERYTTIDPVHMTVVKVNLSARCRFAGRGNKAYKGELKMAGFTRVGTKQPANFLIPHSSEASGVFRLGGEGDQPFNAVNACNDELNKRVATSGDSKYEIMAKGFDFTYPAGLRSTYAFRCNATGLGRTDLESRGVNLNTRLRCLASPAAAEKIPEKPKPARAAIKPARLVPLLQAATFEASPEVHTGDCPVTVQFNGTLTSNRAGTVEYRYTKYDGTQSPVFKLAFDKAGTKKTRNWATTYNKPNAATTLSMGGGGANQTHDFAGWYRLDVLSPKPTGQIAADYRVMCGADDRPAPEEAMFAPAPEMPGSAPTPRRAIRVQPRQVEQTLEAQPALRKVEPAKKKQ
ncbi:MAG: hypothetical protein AAGA44_01560 [Pseudomonadota bacterium]